jgi:superfamily II DNA/RNA helicase
VGFLPDVRRIMEILRSDRQTMLFSAALDGDVGQLRIGSPRTRSDTRSVRAA